MSHIYTDETVQYILLHCPAHRAARQMLRNSIGGRDIKIARLLINPKTLRALFRYVAETGRFHSTFGDIPAIEKKKNLYHILPGAHLIYRACEWISKSVAKRLGMIQVFNQILSADGRLIYLELFHRIFHQHAGA